MFGFIEAVARLLSMCTQCQEIDTEVLVDWIKCPVHNQTLSSGVGNSSMPFQDVRH
jgi:hypothetical protein